MNNITREEIANFVDNLSFDEFIEYSAELWLEQPYSRKRMFDFLVSLPTKDQINIINDIRLKQL